MMKYPEIIRDNIDFISDTEVCNLGYNAGKLDDTRPWRIEGWTSYGKTFVTIFISIKGLENKSETEIKEIIKNNNLIEIIKDDIYITEVTDISENDFLSINIPLLDNDKILNKCLVELKDYDL